MGYTKLFSSIVTSTIWMEDDRTRIVWITLLACADKNGEIQASIPGLARIAGVPVEHCRKAIEKFLKPDFDSRTKDDEGRRVEIIDGGWRLINFLKYRELASRDEQREAEAKRKARWREQKARNGTLVQNVPECPGHVPETLHIADADADADADAQKELPIHTHEVASDSEAPLQGRLGIKIKQCGQNGHPCLETCKLQAVKIGIPEPEGEAFFNYYEANGWRVGKNPMRSWVGAMANWKKNWQERGMNTSGNGTKQTRAPTIMDLKTVVETKKQRAASLKNKFCSESALSTSWSDEKAHGEYRDLWSDIKKLNLRIESMA